MKITASTMLIGAFVAVVAGALAAPSTAQAQSGYTLQVTIHCDATAEMAAGLDKYREVPLFGGSLHVHDTRTNKIEDGVLLITVANDQGYTLMYMPDKDTMCVMGAGGNFQMLADDSNEPSL